MLRGSMAMGTYRLRGQECEEAVYTAIKVGYRVIDTAVIYKNHKAVGVALQRAIAEGLCTRAQLFVTTKVFNGDQRLGKDAIHASLKQALHDLQLDTLDLVLLHRWMPDFWEEAWIALEQLQTEGVCSHIGVSNYYTEQLNTLRNSSRCTVMPAVNQIEISPFHKPHKTIALCRELGIIIQAHTPLIKGIKFEDERLVAAAKAQGSTVPQLLLAWSLSKGWCLAVRTHDPQHIAENWSSQFLKLTSDAERIVDDIQEHFVTHPDLLAYCAHV